MQEGMTFFKAKLQEQITKIYIIACIQFKIADKWVTGIGFGSIGCHEYTSTNLFCSSWEENGNGL